MPGLDMPDTRVRAALVQECDVQRASDEDSNGSMVHATDLTIDLREARSQIRSRERVWDLAEVYTHEREVHAMLDLVPDMFTSLDTTFFEPACGDGNFLVEILVRKLQLIDERTHGRSANWFEMAVLRAVTSIYAVDISEDNVVESRRRMAVVGESVFARTDRKACGGFEQALRDVLSLNIVLGDTLDGAENIQFIEWRVTDCEKFVCVPFNLVEPELDLFYVPPVPKPAVHFTQLSEMAKL